MWACPTILPFHLLFLHCCVKNEKPRVVVKYELTTSFSTLGSTRNVERCKTNYTPCVLHAFNMVQASVYIPPLHFQHSSSLCQVTNYILSIYFANVGNILINMIKWEWLVLIDFLNRCNLATAFSIGLQR